MGLDVETPMSSPFATRWDARDGADESDHGWVGEDARGVWLRVDPTAALSQRPALWPVVDSVLAGGLAEIDARDWDTLSAYEHAAKRAMVSALTRKAAGRG